jgi:uncharacterized protein
MTSTREDLLDEALKLTFPASDPIAIDGDIVPMKIVLFGPSTVVGQRVAREACARGHHLTVISRMPFRYERPDSRVVVLGGDPTDVERVASSVRGFTAVVSAVQRDAEDDGRLLARVASALVTGLPLAGVQRLVVVGSSPEMDEVEREALERYRTSDLEWTYVSPAVKAEPGVRTGKYHSSTDEKPGTPAPVRISAEDLAVAVLDELEQPLNVRHRVTVG